MSITDIYKNLFGRKGIQDGNVIDMSEHGRVGGLSTGQPFKFVADLGGIGLNPFDYFDRTVVGATETYTFRSGGPTGDITNTVVIVYTDETLSDILNATKT